LLGIQVAVGKVLVIISFFVNEGFCYKNTKKDHVGEQQLWENWKREHGKTYSGSEEILRFNNFKANLEIISNLNKKGNPISFYGTNQFSDLTFEEFRDQIVMQGARYPTKQATQREPSKGIPDTVDWRAEGAVTPVYNQGQCGSSPYFAAATALEGSWKIAGNKLEVLSVQQINDCSSDFGNNGCSGGYMNFSISYAAKFGMETNATYPYTGSDGTTCTYDSTKVVAHFTKFIECDGSEASMTEALVIAPVATAVMITNSWQSYQSGIIDDPTCNSDEIYHGIAVVGYGADDQGNQYYIMKNSWGSSWGMNGFAFLARNKGNMCGVAIDACYAVV